jgi:hypothetical protein
MVRERDWFSRFWLGGLPPQEGLLFRYHHWTISRICNTFGVVPRRWQQSFWNFIRQSVYQVGENTVQSRKSGGTFGLEVLV